MEIQHMITNGMPSVRLVMPIFYRFDGFFLCKTRTVNLTVLFFMQKKDKKGERNEENFKKDRRYAPDLYDVFSDLRHACKCGARYA